MYHLSCSKFDEEVYSVLKKQKCFKDIFWCCNLCRGRGAKVDVPSNDTMMSLINALQDRVSKLEDVPSISNPAEHFPSLTTTQVDHSSHQVLMIPNENQKLDLKTFSEIAKSKLPDIPIKKLGITSKGHGFIKLPDKSICDKALNKLKDEYNVTAKKTEQREFLPKITVYDINSDDYSNNNKDDLKTAILNKNPAIKTTVDEGNLFEVLFIVPEKSKNVSKAVIKLDPKILQVIKDSKYKIYIDYGSCRVSDRFFAKQCYNCQKFGHRSENCSADKPTCRFCAAKHKSSSCTVRTSKNKSNLKCANCSGNHCTSDISCPVLRKQVDYVIARTKGMENFPKNLIPPYAIAT